MKNETATEIIRRNLRDPTKVDTMEVADELIKTLPEQLEIAVERGKKHLDEDCFAVVQILKSDKRFPNALKRVFFYSAFLPKPTPDQSVWIYKKSTGDLTFMWSLPDREACALLSWMINVDKKWSRTSQWCRALYDNTLVDLRRKETGVFLETEKEFLISNKNELAQAVGNDVERFFTDSIY